jgi:acetolactate synthase-1/3 small subunit
MQRVISFIVSNQPGVLSRVAGLISRRGFNIESLTVGVTDDPKLSRITIVMFAEDAIIDQVIKQLDKLLDVKAIKEIPQDAGSLQEIALVKVNSSGKSRRAFTDLINNRWGRIMDIGNDTVTVRLTGTTDSINKSIEMFKEYGIVEVARTGMVALERGDEKLY